jgi:hypothetical protein
MHLSLHDPLRINSLSIDDGSMDANLVSRDGTVRSNVESVSETVLHKHRSMMFILIHWLLRFHLQNAALRI